jgi:hypothetical protein
MAGMWRQLKKVKKKQFDEIRMTNFERKEMGVTGSGSTGS